MGGKHLKKMRAEKSKVKLKQKKTLPKGQNITDTSFKVRKIVTVEQFKTVGENEPVSSWNVTLKDLLTRLGHYNYTSRLNGLTGIKELIVKYPDVLKGPLLRPTVSRILELLIDPEHKIRVTAIGLLESLFSMLTPASVTPFQDILIVHLSCAMTHREIAVEQDSLKFIDVVNNHAPEAVKKNFPNLLQNFIRIFKTFFYGSRSEIQITKGSKLDLEKTRAKMFHRFYQILTTIYAVPEDEEKKSNEGITVSSNSNQRICLRDLNNDFKKTPDLSSLFKKSKDEEIVLKKSESVEFQSQANLIMPLLFDTCSEFMPSRQSDGFTSEFVLTETVAELLYIILKILLLLYEKMTAMKDPDLESWFISTCSLSFKKAFVSNFPYMPSISSKKVDFSNGEPQNSNSSAFMLQNLIICYLYYSLKIRHKNNDYETKIERYVTNALTLTAKNPQGSEIISKVLEAILNNSKGKKSDNVVTAAVKTYYTANNPELKRRIFKILMKIALEEKYEAYHSNQSFVKWMKSLPERLQKQKINSYVIETILKVISRPLGAEVLKEVESRVVDIIENLPNAKIEGMDQFTGQKMIANILFWCNNQVLEEAVQKGILQKKSYPQELRSYIIDIFSYRLTGQSTC